MEGARKKKDTKHSLAEQNIPDELSPRWGTFVDVYLKTGNAYQSALTAGFSDEYAKVITSRYPEKVSKSLKEALEEKGITALKIADKINLLLEAKKEDLPDYNAIDKGITHALKARGDIKEEESKVVNVTYNVMFSPEVREKVNLINETIKNKLLGNA